MKDKNGENAVLSWLGERPTRPVGVTWGVPWKEGELSRDTPLALYGTNGESLPVQSWPMAFWPDGSLKWTAHAAVFPGDPGEQFELVRGEGTVVSAPLAVQETVDTIEVDTGAIRCRIGRSGTRVLREIWRNGKQICTGGTLIGLHERRLRTTGKTTIVEEPFQGVVEQTVVEQAGPLRAVIRIAGHHPMDGHRRKWLPFVLRLYFYAGIESIRLVYTFIYDGNPHQDLIKGLGIRFVVPMTGPLYNRHLRFAGDTGLFSESPKGLMLFRLQDRQRRLYEQQTAGAFIRFDDMRDAQLLALLDDSPVWGDFKLTQVSSDSYNFQTHPQRVQLDPGGGWQQIRRAGLCRQ